jgi:formate hydrogenlyase subunit 3/multisubunit Na+/H+ antiporter MnhD subunit
VSLLGTLVGIAGTIGLVRLILQAGLAPGHFWLPIALLLPASYVLIARLMFPVSSEAGSGTSQR